MSAHIRLTPGKARSTTAKNRGLGAIPEHNPPTVRHMLDLQMLADKRSSKAMPRSIIQCVKNPPRVTDYRAAKKKFHTNTYKTTKAGKVRARHTGDALFAAKRVFIKKAKRRGMTVPQGVTFSNTIKLAEKKNSITFKDWKQGREAQHLVPAAIAMKHGVSDALINHPSNIMMLPAGNRKNNLGLSAAYRNLKKTSPGTLKLKNPKHIKNGVAHPRYNKFVAKKAGKTLGKPGGFAKLAAELRALHKKGSTGNKYVDDLS